MEAQCRWCDTASSQQLPHVLSLCLEHPVTMVGYQGQIDIPGVIRKGKHAWDSSFKERPLQHRPPPKSCTPATAIRTDAIDFLLERMRKVDPRTMEKLPFDMFLLDSKWMPDIAFLSSPLAGQSSGRDPGAPVATGNWGRATCEKNTWIPCPPLDWSELKNMQMGDVQWCKGKNAKKQNNALGKIQVREGLSDAYPLMAGARRPRGLAVCPWLFQNCSGAGPVRP